jgi:hypothetical protein
MVAGWLRLSGPAGSKCGWRQRSQPGRWPVTGRWRGGAGVVNPQAVPGQPGPGACCLTRDPGPVEALRAERPARTAGIAEATEARETRRGPPGPPAGGPATTWS